MNLFMLCAAVVLWDGTPEMQYVPPLVKGVLIGEHISGGKEYFKLRFRDTFNRERVLSFEANTCRFEQDK